MQKKLATIVCVALAMSCHGAPPREPVRAFEKASSIHGATAFVGVNVVPMDRPGVVADQTVIVAAGRIVGVGPRGTTPIPPDATQIDGRGKYLMPGLADMHVHVEDWDNLALFVANGVTTVRDMFGSPEQLAWREKAKERDFFGPMVHTAGPIVDGNPPTSTAFTVVATTADAERIVHEQKSRGYEFIKVYDNLSAPVYAALVESAKKEGMPVIGHVPVAVGLEGVLASGQRSIEHLTGYFAALGRPDSPVKGKLDIRSRYILSAKYVDEKRIPALVEATKAADVWNCFTLVTPERAGIDPATQEKYLAAPEMQYVPRAIKSGWKGDNSWLIGTPPDYESPRRAIGVRRKIARALHDGGAHVLLGTDTPNAFVVPGFSIHTELRNLVEVGFSPYEAIKAGTRDAAVFLGEEREFGAVAVGLRADLMLVDGDPLADVANVARRSGIMLRGTWYSSADLDARLAAIVAGLDAPRKRFVNVEKPAGELIGRYEVSYGGDAPVGEERIFVETRSDGTKRIAAQQSVDPPFAEEDSVVVDFDKDGLPVSSMFRSTQPRGKKELFFERVAAASRLRGAVTESAPIDSTVPGPPPAVLDGPMLAYLSPLGPLVKGIAVGQTKTLSVVNLATHSGVTIERGTFVVTRKPDANATTRVYALRATAPKEPYTADVTFDSSDRIVTMRIDAGGFIIGFRRIE